MSKKRFNLLCYLVALCLTVCSTVPLTAFAKSKAEEKAQALTSVEVTGIDVPAAGVALDNMATVKTAEGKTWEVPIVWTDENRNVVKTAEVGKRYFPTFAFYVPDGFKVGRSDKAGRFNATFPSFLTAAYGADKFIFALDRSTGITYVIYAPGYLVPGGIPRSVWDQGKANESQTDSSQQGSDPAPTPTPSPTPTPEPEPELSDIDKYCSDSAKQNSNDAFLNYLIDLIKNKIEPQAVELLREKFPESFGSAEPGKELSDEIGLYVYFKTGELNGEACAPGALAFVTGDYDDDGKFIMAMGVDLSSFMKYNEATGEYYIPEDIGNGDGSTIYDFENTIVHEMLHAFMFDYNRYGMRITTADESGKPGGTKATGQAFTTWFMEGMATTVENCYQFRNGEFKLMFNNGYTSDSILAAYTDDQLQGSERLDLRFCDDKENTGSAYVSGYLACAYLGYLSAMQNGLAPIDQDGNVSMTAIRTGLDKILTRLHGSGDGSNSECLDTIIRGISNGAYQNTADFQDRFIKGEGEDGSNGNNLATRAFVLAYLNWLESNNWTDENGKSVAANGSILFDDQNYRSPLDPQKNTEADVYKIANNQGMADSSVDDRRASTTGGTTKIGPNANGSANDTSQTGSAAAKAKTAETAPATQTAASSSAGSTSTAGNTTPAGGTTTAGSTTPTGSTTPASSSSSSDSSSSSGSTSAQDAAEPSTKDDVAVISAQSATAAPQENAASTVQDTVTPAQTDAANASQQAAAADQTAALNTATEPTQASTAATTDTTAVSAPADPAAVSVPADPAAESATLNSGADAATGTVSDGTSQASSTDAANPASVSETGSSSDTGGSADTASSGQDSSDDCSSCAAEAASQTAE